MTDPTVSVIVVSRDRPELLQRCLLGVSQLYYAAFEIIVVADQLGLDVVANSGFSGKIKTALCEVANISIARNLGLDMAAGEVVAFLDDDSVPEPTWLNHLAKVFQNKTVCAAGGYVLGRNGISFSTKAQTIDVFGVTTAIELDGPEPVIRAGTELETVKTEGTNCAFRRNVFEEIGMFDPGFSYFLDESDVNIRIAKAGYKSAIVPLAQVHHSAGGSERRHVNGVPYSLYQSGMSAALFLRKHCPTENVGKAWQEIQQQNKRQLHRHMIIGNCEPEQIERLIATMEDGFVCGQRLQVTEPLKLTSPKERFVKFSDDQKRGVHQIIVGTWWSRRRSRQKAAKAVATGKVVSLLLLSYTSLYHHVRYHPGGFWEQSGGLFGRSVRNEKLFRWHTLESRIHSEFERLALVRKP